MALKKKIPARGSGAAKKKKTVSPERIAQRAYEKFQHRGGSHGGHLDDWLQAEQELKSEWSEE